MNGKSNLGSDISKSMTRCRMLVTITQVTAKTCQTDEQRLESIQELTQKMT